MTSTSTPGVRSTPGAASIPGSASAPGAAPTSGVTTDESTLLTPEADAAFSALADRTRRRVLVRLADKPDDAGAVAKDLGLSRQAVAKHMRLLADAGLVRSRQERRRQVHTVDAGRIREVSDLLAVVSRAWDRRLMQVKELAERRNREADGTAPEYPGAPVDG